MKLSLVFYVFVSVILSVNGFQNATDAVTTTQGADENKNEEKLPVTHETTKSLPTTQADSKAEKELPKNEDDIGIATTTKIEESNTEKSKSASGDGNVDAVRDNETILQEWLNFHNSNPDIYILGPPYPEYKKPHQYASDPNPETSTEPYVSTFPTNKIYPYSTYIAAPRVYYDELKDSEELDENIKVENDFPPLDLPYPKSSRISKNEDIDPRKIERKWRFEGDYQTKQNYKKYDELRNANDRDWNDEFDVNRDRHRLFKDNFNDPRSEEDSNPDGGDNTHKPHLGASRRRPSSSRDQGSREFAEKLEELKTLNRLIRTWLKKNHNLVKFK